MTGDPIEILRQATAFRTAEALHAAPDALARLEALRDAAAETEQRLRQTGEHARDHMPGRVIECSGAALISWADVLRAALAACAPLIEGRG